MKKFILAGVLVIVMIFSSLPCIAADAPITVTFNSVNGTLYKDGVEGQGVVPSGTQAIVYILKQITDGAATADEVKTKLPSLINEGKIVYTNIITVGENGSVNHSFTLDNSLPTATCEAIIHYSGAASPFSIGSFKHINENEVIDLIKMFNGEAPYAGNTAYDTYTEIMAFDIHGSDGTADDGKNILESKGANIADYSTFSPAIESEVFCKALSVLQALQTDGKYAHNAVDSLITDFNKAVAFGNLASKSDTSDVLLAHNTDCWSLQLDADSDYGKLPSEQQAKLLTAIKNGKYTTGTDVETAFTNELKLAKFRAAVTREELEVTIADSYFASLGTILTNAGLIGESLDLSETYNRILLGNMNCATLKEAETLFTNSLPTKSSSSNVGGGYTGRPIGGGSSGGGWSGSLSPSVPTTPIAVKFPFKDVSDSHWAKDYISRLYNEKVINGVSDTEFAPDEPVARNAYVKIFVGALGLELSLSDSVFSDLSIGCYWEPYIMTAYEKGYISGIGNGEFGLTGLMKRQDAAVILARVLTEKGIAEGNEKFDFADSADISDYARDSLEYVASLGIFKGDANRNVNPHGTLSRSEACALLCRLADMLKGE